MFLETTISISKLSVVVREDICFGDKGRKVWVRYVEDPPKVKGQQMYFLICASHFSCNQLPRNSDSEGERYI